MPRLRLCRFRTSRRCLTAIFVLVCTFVAGCRSDSAVVRHKSSAPTRVAAPAQPSVQLTSYHETNARDAVEPAISSSRMPQEELPPPFRLGDPQSTGNSPNFIQPPVIAVDLERMTLDEAISTALRNNPRLRQAAARVGGARASVDIAYAPFLPQIGTSFRYSAFTAPVLPGGSFVPASLDTGVTSFVVAEAGVQWTLYDFGRTQGRYGQAKDRAQIEELALVRARQTIAFEAAQAYFRLLSAEANLAVREEAFQRAKSILRDTEARNRNGTADRENVLRAQVEVAQVQEDLFSARQAIHDGEALLNVLLGRSAAAPIRISNIDSEPEFRESFETCLEIASMSRREIQIARTAVAEARNGVVAARGEMLPKVFIRGAVIRADSPGPLNDWVEGIGLHAEQKIFTGGANRGEVRRSQAQVVDAMAALQSILDQITLQVRVSYEAIGTDVARIRLGERTIGQARENLRLTEVKYNNGTATSTDIVDAQTALVEAESAYITAIYSYLSDLAQLQYAMGNGQYWLIEQSNIAGRSP